MARCAAGVVPPSAARSGVGAAGSGVMMLTGGVEAADGKSALVGLPVGIERRERRDRRRRPPGGGAFHDGA